MAPRITHALHSLLGEHCGTWVRRGRLDLQDRGRHTPELASSQWRIIQELAVCDALLSHNNSRVFLLPPTI